MCRARRAWTMGLTVLTAFTWACQNADYSPKPRGYHRIIFPQKAYQSADTDGCPFVFDIPAYSRLEDDISRNARPCWKNLDFPEFNARLHLSYFRISPTASFDQLTEDARTFVFKHTTKATAIDQTHVSYPAQKVYGIEYSIKGNTASNFQFYLSDSTTNYLRGALYFNEKPNLDSIQPVLEFLKEDIRHLIHTFRWR
ncbi:gliding motility lipoprotein GldD [Parapedobacter sp. SGR-10]|uniref:gliding motility lipoprotein GldD n=1 Tax=Parapedobacter sp. SGR-10 TaxID=2710879 RepID=UPI001F1190C6|nr:gliding motility lipoprotein GldD [Parapedobacter sp. SGR-10]